MMAEAANEDHSKLSKAKVKAMRNLEQPDFTYKGMMFSDGVTD